MGPGNAAGLQGAGDVGVLPVCVKGGQGEMDAAWGWV